MEVHKAPAGNLNIAGGSFAYVRSLSQIVEAPTDEGLEGEELKVHVHLEASFGGASLGLSNRRP